MSSDAPFRRQIDALLDPLAEFWAERDRREQVLIGIMLAVALVGLVLTFIITPLGDARDRAQVRIDNSVKISAWLAAGGRPSAAGTRRRDGAAADIITESAAAAGLAIARTDADGSGNRVILTGVPFDRLVQWVADLEQTSRLRVVEAELRRAGAEGTVNATVVIAG